MFLALFLSVLIVGSSCIGLIFLNNEKQLPHEVKISNNPQTRTDWGYTDNYCMREYYRNDTLYEEPYKNCEF